MTKEIRKNREALIRHFYISQNTMGGQDGDRGCLCARQRIAEAFGFNTLYGELKHTRHPDLLPLIGFSELDWVRVEQFYEGWNSFEEEGPKTLHQVADWLQTLPGWPRVL